MNQVIFYKEKNKQVFIRITEFPDKRTAVHYSANGLGIVSQFKNNESLNTIIDKTIKEINEFIKDRGQEQNKVNALKWIKKELYKLKQPTLF